MSHDLLAEFPQMKGFSHRNLKSIRQWYRFWTAGKSIGKQAVSQSGSKGKQVVSLLEPVGRPPHRTIAAQLVSQIPWGHNVLLLQKLDDPADALFYVQKTIENNWSRAVLTHQIESGLHRSHPGALPQAMMTMAVGQCPKLMSGEVRVRHE